MDSWHHTIPMLRDGRAAELLHKVEQLRQTHVVYPPADCVFRALELTSFNEVRAVILGQDPYHGEGQAHGLAFSVPEGASAPPSLRNIFKEVARDVYGGDAPALSTNLERWARQGVLLLNSSLTVEAGRAGSHQQLGWHALTDQIVEALSQQRRHLVFMLWGGHAQSKRALIDGDDHLVLESAHPSPLSAYRGFFGCRHFSQANAYLEAHKKAPVIW